MNFIKNPTYELDKFFKSNNFNRIFIITGLNSFYKSSANLIFKKIFVKEKSLFYFKKKSIPDVKELIYIVKTIKRYKPDLIVAIGGGTVLDYAKSAHIIDDLIDLNKKIINSSIKVKKKCCKLVAIPTTAGSGAEVTSNAVIYINNKKYSIEDKLLLPDYYFLIPQLILSNSRIIKASSGFDCISQSIESLISIKSNKTSVNYASKSLKIALNHYLNFLKKPNDLNSFKMSLAANLSGKAINISKTTAPHAISYPFTSFFKVPHGHAVSLTLNDFLKFNYFNLEKSKTNFSLKRRFELIFAIAKVKSINDLDLLLKNIKKEAKLESNFDKLGINIKSNFTKVIEGVNKRRLINNPVKVTNIDIKSILLKVK